MCKKTDKVAIRFSGFIGPETNPVRVYTEPIDRHPSIEREIERTLRLSGWKNLKIEIVRPGD